MFKRFVFAIAMVVVTAMAFTSPAMPDDETPLETLASY